MWRYSTLIAPRLPRLQDEQRELAKTIRVSGSILLSTVSNFLDFFKMEAGKALDIVRTEVDVQVPPLSSVQSLTAVLSKRISH